MGASTIQPKRAAVLAYLAVAEPGPWHRRDTLVAMFWPESTDSQARNALRQVLHYLRQTLGSDAVVSRGAEEVGLAPDAVWSDVGAFRQAIALGEYHEAADLYRGHLLDGFHVSEAYAFEDWLDRERARLRRQAVDTAWVLSDLAWDKGDRAGTRRWAFQASDWNPTDEGGLGRLLRVLEREGDRAGALRAYHQFERRLQSEFGIAPSEETTAWAERLKASSPSSSSDGASRAPRPDVWDDSSLVARSRTPVLDESSDGRWGPASNSREASPLRARLSERRAWALGAATILAITAASVSVIKRTVEPEVSTSETSGLLHLAVLPFENISLEESDAFYADGLHDEVIGAVGQIGSLVVRPRTSVLAYSGSPLSLPEIGRALAVSHVLEATVQVGGGLMRVTPRLIEVGSQTPLWSAEFEARVASSEDLWRVQDSIAIAVADALRLELDRQVEDRPTESDAAYSLYLRSFEAPLGVAGNVEGMALLHQAIVFDPGFASAHAQLAYRYAGSVQVMGGDPSWTDSAATHAIRAVQLDSTHAFGWFALAQARLNQGRLDDAVDAYDRASSVAPTWAPPRAQRAFLLFLLGRLDESMDAYVDAMWLEPNVRVSLTGVANLLSTIGERELAGQWVGSAESVIPDHPATRSTRIALLSQQGRWREARDAGDRWIRDAPTNHDAYSLSARAAFAEGDLQAAVELAQQAHRLRPDARSIISTTNRSILGAALLGLDQSHSYEGEAILRGVIDENRKVIEAGEERPGVYVDIAAAHAALGEVDAAMTWLEAAFDRGWRHGSWGPAGLSQFRDIESDARFQGWLERQRADVERMGARAMRKHSNALAVFLQRWHELNPAAPRG